MDFMFEDEVDEVGSDVEAYCPKCKADTTHVVISKYEDEIRRVQCNPCGDVHSFRKPRGEVEDDVPEPVAARKRASLKKPTWEEFFAKHSGKNAKPYEFRELYKENVIVTHPKFGNGFVSEVVSDSKVEITFKDARRILVHNRRDIPGLPLAAVGDGMPTPPKPAPSAKGAGKDQGQGRGKDAGDAVSAKDAPGGKAGKDVGRDLRDGVSKDARDRGEGRSTGGGKETRESGKQIFPPPRDAADAAEGTTKAGAAAAKGPLGAKAGGSAKPNAAAAKVPAPKVDPKAKATPGKPEKPDHRPEAKAKPVAKAEARPAAEAKPAPKPSAAKAPTKAPAPKGKEKAEKSEKAKAKPVAKVAPKAAASAKKAAKKK